MTIRSSCALVTGGGTGIGRATALELARQGARGVAIDYSISDEDARQAQEDLAAIGVQTLAVKADLRRESEVKLLVAKAVQQFGGLDILVNDAGTTRYVPLKDLKALTHDIWDMTFERICGARSIVAGRPRRVSRRPGGPSSTWPRSPD